MSSPLNWFTLGDEFTIAYIYLADVESTILMTPSTFLISQATESYLKGCLMLKTDNDPVEYGHNQFKIFNELKNDPEFLPTLNIPQKIYDGFDISMTRKKNSKKDQAMMDEYYPLLLAFKYGFELKYFGVGLKSVKSDVYGYSQRWLDPLYSTFISEIRKYSGMNEHHHNAWTRLKGSNLYGSFSDEKKRFVNSIMAS